MKGLTGSVGVVLTTMGGKNMTFHVRFASIDVVALNVQADQFEPVDTIEPELPVKSKNRLRVV